MLITAPIMQPLDWSLLFEIKDDVSDYTIRELPGQRKDKNPYMVYVLH